MNGISAQGLEIVFSTAESDLARVHVGRLADGTFIEMVESVQPPTPRREKWVLIVSTLKGCPISCPICDAGGDYRGPLTSGEIVAQVDALIATRYPGVSPIPVKRLKVQFARTGEPALNDAVIDALEHLAERADLPGLFPSVSTVAPAGRDAFFERLLAVKERHFAGGCFQLQFSLHSTDERMRRHLIPARTWTFAQMASYGNRFVKDGDRKVTLNFAPATGLPLDADQIAGVFSQDRFLVKLTPINPTKAALRSGLSGLIEPCDADGCRVVARGFEDAGYETIISIGELEENAIGSNCGMYLDHAARQPATSAVS